MSTDPKHEYPCPLPCEACESECSPNSVTESATDLFERAWSSANRIDWNNLDTHKQILDHSQE